MHEFDYTTAPRRTAKGDVLVAAVRFDNRCRNIEPYFSVTGTIYGPQRIPYEDRIRFEGKFYWAWGGGCVHEEITSTFPELEPFLKYHLCSPSGPMHYISNGLYWHKLWGDSIAGPPWSEDKYVLEHGTDKLRQFFCNTICFEDGEADLNELVCWDAEQLTTWLRLRLPPWQRAFEEAMQAVCSLRGTLCT